MSARLRGPFITLLIRIDLTITTIQSRLRSDHHRRDPGEKNWGGARVAVKDIPMVGEGERRCWTPSREIHSVLLQCTLPQLTTSPSIRSLARLADAAVFTPQAGTAHGRTREAFRPRTDGLSHSSRIVLATARVRPSLLNWLRRPRFWVSVHSAPDNAADVGAKLLSA
jgi:hypothetical protein